MARGARKSLLLLWGDEFGGRGSGALLGAAFLFHVLGAFGDFVVEGFDFAGEVKVLRVLGVGFEQRVSLGLQIVAFLFPDTGYGNHGFNLGSSVRYFAV
jgi:hypothetical protein